MGLKSFATLVSCCFLGTSCADGNFTSAAPSAPKGKKVGIAEGATDTTKSDDGSAPGKGSAIGDFNLQQLGCEDETRTVPAKISIHKSPSEQVVSLTHICKLQVETETMSSSKYPADIVFVIDITGSMQPNINAIKDNVVRFARELENRSWDARFAAVGFRDSIEGEVQFTDAEQLRTKINDWSADKGGDAQEFSQGGIVKALDMLLEDLSDNPNRAKADKIILMVTDNPGFEYVSRNKNSFSTDNLEQRIQQSSMSLTRLKFYHSTPTSEQFRSTRSFVRPNREPREQYNNLIKNTGVIGAALEYPLSEDVILNQFVETFEPVRATVERSCRITELEVRDSNGMVRSDAFTLKAGEALQSAVVKSNILPKNSLAQLTGQRCCSESEDPNAACTESKPISIPFRVN